jgi:sugar-specific transcriptional regulator TrmB
MLTNMIKHAKLFTMLDNKNKILKSLNRLGLSKEESLIYIEVLKSPKTHLRLSHVTGINRTKVYRLAEELEKKSLVTRRTDDRGTFLTATDPANLEVDLVAREEDVRKQREAFRHVLPSLAGIQEQGDSAFIVRTYEGHEGIKQMLWHELKSSGDVVIFGSGTTEELITDHYWAERHRQLSAQAGYKVRELMNQDKDHRPVDFTEHADFMNLYRHKRIPRSVLPLDNQTSVYNDTVATYYWRQDQKVGVEIVNKAYASMMRQIFETYWEMASEY